MLLRKGDSKETIQKKMKRVLEAHSLNHFTDDKIGSFVVNQMGNDLPIKVMVTVTEETVEFWCELAFEADEENYDNIVRGLNDLNAAIPLGAFLIEPVSKIAIYRYSYIYVDMSPGLDLLFALLNMAVNTVDAHDGELRAIMPIREKFDRYNKMFN
ncbi:MAG: hypothetical protein E7Z67_05645 [Thermoplasmata archaeon]|nr:hypothetical protein [Thermoplasmata archaeon]